MPWHVTKSSKCPDSKPWAVVKDTDGSIVACHATEGSAKKQMAALYANEPGMHDAGTETDNTEAPMADDLMTQTQRATAPPTDNLFRMADFTVVRDATVDGEPDDGLTLDGYAAVFNRETVIDSWEGRFKEKIAPGAMRKSFRERPPKMQFDHGKHPMVGSIPIASIRSITEEVDADLAPEGGAHVIARLFDNWLVQPVRDAIAEGAISGMSFRFSVVREEWADHTGKVIKDPEVLRDALFRSWFEDIPEDELLVRTLKEVKVPELGPVMWPAYAETSVGVRNKVEIDLATLRTDPAQRRALAEAVLLADAAEREEIESPEPTPQRAEPHEEIPNDPPRVTVKADEHESPHEPVSARKVDMVLRDMRARLKSIPDKKE